MNLLRGVGMDKKKKIPLEEALIRIFEESGNVAFQSINEMHNILRNEINKAKK